MRICLASIHPRRVSGQIESLLGLAEQLERLGDEVVLASAFAPGELLHLADEGARGMLGKLRRVWQALQVVEHRARGADVLYLALPTPAFALLGDVLRVRTGLPVVVAFEAHLADPAQLLFGGYLARDARFYLPRLLINNGLVARWSAYRCDRYVVSTELQRRELLRLGVPAERVCVLPNVSHNRKLASPSQAQARARLGLSAGPLVSYVGHFHHVKGADLLATACGAVLRRHPRAALAIAWSGLGDPRPIRRNLAENGLAAGAVWFGQVDVGAVLAASDVLALPYRLTIGQNAFPNVLLEALSVGVPLVTSRLPLLEELLRDGDTALLVPPNDAASLALAIDRLLRDAALRGRMRAQQRRLVAQRLAPELLARHYHALFLEVQHGQAGILQPAAHRA
jgi:glycosyltransferase involved in cell wall biosynthesis